MHEPSFRNPLSRREVLKFGAFTTVGGVLTPSDAPGVDALGAAHAFLSDDRPQAYKKEAAEDAWKRCTAFFDLHLKA